MNKSHKKILLESRMDIVKDLDVNNILSYLYQERILSENDVELIKAEKTRKSRTELLLDTVPRKGPKAFAGFVDSLNRQNSTKHLAEMLLDLTGEDTTDSPKVKPAKEETPQNVSKTRVAYSMSHKPHGICLIVNNKEFLGDLSVRTGTDIDAKNLKDLFSQLNFTIKLIKNATAVQMMEAIKDIAARDHSATDCLIVCLLSHGISGKIYASDGELLPLSELLEPLLMCAKKPELVDIPRLFFIQACRVVKEVAPSKELTDIERARLNNFEVTLHSKEAGNDSSALEEPVVNSTELLIKETAAPLQANILMSYSTFPGEEAWRNLETGSWFISALFDVFKAYSAREDLMSMILRVNDAVSKRVSATSKAKQIPAPIVTLTKKLFFNT